ncbi:SMP-30/gluconolactonase/LRE family protein [Bosea sp. (in: a-proteobacteria)]|uniref:SMP-30/gluconolactonase/LRE family protein n=1 Tax=Bosea sp. (in: a-proteobacteria) TaxID=1871050 RepID=UPI002608F070|nr:SMP-30/gluconolactonase/LRE family protein [Bosea sp. (in: a-proteobacteria)]MCO5089808.1 SMP-30/gluconolactonase/LRE family protein [Bosea sp. (in: a-proteobacteria)]
MFAPPPAATATIFATLPDSLRMKGRRSQFIDEHPGHVPTHSVLEGPSFDRDGNLYCVDIPFGRIFRVDPKGNFSLFVEYDGWPNGLKVHRDGRFFVTDFKRGIVVIDPDTRKVEPFLERYRLEHLKAPNDLVFASNGDMYFTDQGLTGLQDPTGRLFRLRADGRLDCLVDTIASPNGVVLDPSEEIVFVAATRQNAVLRVPMLRDGGAAKVGIFIQMSGGSGPDGLAIDEKGGLAVAHVGLGAVWLFTPRGEPRLRIDAPNGYHTTNLAFGGPDRRTLYITESESATILAAPAPEAGLTMFSHR